MRKKESKIVFYLWIVLLTIVCNSYNLEAKQLVGVVLDEKMESVGGAIVESDNLQTISGPNGHFVLEGVLSGRQLIVHKSGFVSLNTTVSEAESDTLILVSDLNNRVQLFNTQKRVGDLSEAVSYIDGDVTQNLSGTNRLNMLSGRLPGLLVMQNDGQPGWENSIISVRGRSVFGSNHGEATILLDGHEADISQLDPYDIESVTVLKDAAAAAMYGLRSGNGVILIKTKRGVKGENRVTLNSQTTLVQPNSYPRLLGAGDYASLYNEALANDGQMPLYSDQDIDTYRNGSSPVTHPNNDYFGDYFGNSSIQTRNNLSLSGGNDRALYRVSLGHTSNDGLLNTNSNENTYNTNTSLEIINLHANMDIQVNDNLSVSADIKAKKEKRIMPGAYNALGVSGLIGEVLNTPSNAYPIFSAPDSLGGSSDFTNNLYGRLNNSGYSQWERYYLSAAVDFTYDFDFLSGLSMIGSGGYNNFGDQIIDRSKSFAVYQPRMSDDGTTFFDKIGDDTNMANTSDKLNQTRFYYAELGLAYNTVFGQSRLGAKVLAENRMTELADTRLPHWNKGLKGRLDYSLQDTYLASFSFSLQGSEQFPKENRYGFFPGVSVGWVASNMDFVKDLDFISYLKLRGSAGITGMDFNAFIGNNYFAYNDKFTQGGYYPFGNSLGYSAPLFNEFADGNDLITWAKSKKMDVGVDAGFLGNKLFLTADYFFEQTEDLLVSGTPGIIGTDYQYPQGVVENKGFEGVITWKDRVGKSFEYFLSANATKATNTIINQNEEAREYPWMYRTGHEVGARFGYLCEGFFTENDDPTTFADQSTLGEVIPGSLRYKDLNNDEVIDERDQTYLGNDDFPEIWYGFSGGMNFKGLDFNFQFSGVANRTILYSGNLAYAFNNGTGALNEWHLERWQPGAGQQASYPSVSLTKSENNKAVSSFWIEDASYLRLQSVELGYHLPKTLIQKIGLQNLRIFVTGSNLVTWSDVKQIDPAGDNTGVGYPISKMFSAGVNLSF